MSDGHEIEFETMDSPRWPEVKTGAELIATQRLQTRYDGVVQGAQWFRDDADTLIKECITKPPGKISGFGVLTECVLAACEVLVPEVGVAHLIYQSTKTTYETIKPAAELVEKANEEFVANSVEQATGHLQELTKQYAEDVADKALAVKQVAQNAVGAALDAYVRDNPQEFKPGDDSYYGTLCDALGIQEPDVNEVKMQVWNKVFPPFKEKLLVAAAQIHFFHEMSDDAERLNFLIDEADKGNDPDVLLRLIGADQVYWDKFLTVYRSSGRDAAMQALTNHLMGMD